MYVHDTLLSHPKSEHNKDTNEDFADLNTERGIFAVSDGVGTASFSNIWSRALIRQFLAEPLLSSDPFELQWWLKFAQAMYDREAPPLEQLEWWARDKAREGSLATLAGIRVAEVTPTAARAILYVVGDSCIFHRSVGGDLHSYMIEDPQGFGVHPICLPSRMKAFSRSFHKCQTAEITIQPGDTIVFATDAVGLWILDKGKGTHPSLTESLEAIVNQATDDQWSSFIDGCRSRNEIVDDDSTVIILRFGATHEAGKPVGTTTCYSESTVAERKSNLLSALENHMSEQVAILFGDGNAMRAAGVEIPDAEIQHAREVADAIAALRASLTAAIAKQSEIPFTVRPVWQRFADLLHNEPSAATLIASLRNQGVLDAPKIPAASQPTSTATNATTTPPQSTAHPSDGVPPSEVVEQLMQAIEAEDDEKIVQLYSDDLGDHTAIRPYRGHIELAKLRISRLRTFQTALATDSDQIIVSSYDPIIERVLPKQQRARLDRARRNIACAQLREAIVQDDDELIFHASEQPHMTLADLTPAEQERVSLAIKRRDALRGLRQALATHDDGVIAQSYNPILDGYPGLTSDERQQLESASKAVAMPALVRKAIEANDDAAIRDSYDQTLVRSYTKFSHEEKERIQLAQERYPALNAFLEALTSEDDEAICNAYNYILDNYLAANPEARARLEEARARSKALRDLLVTLDSDDDDQILAAYDPILRDRLESLGDRRERLTRAQTRAAARPRVLAALQAGNFAEIAQFYSPMLDDDPKLLPEQQRQIKDALLAVKSLDNFHWAVQTENDHTIVLNFWPILLQHLELLTPEQFARLHLAHVRVGAYLRFRHALASDDPRAIRQAYNSVLDDSPLLSEEERTRYRQALKQQGFRDRLLKG